MSEPFFTDRKMEEFTKALESLQLNFYQTKLYSEMTFLNKFSSNIPEIKTKLAANIPSFCSKINPKYIQLLFMTKIFVLSNIEVLFFVQEDGTPFDLTKLIGFLIVEEKKNHTHTKRTLCIYSITLMCVKKDHLTIQQSKYIKSGNLLIGTFLFCLLDKSHALAILELAHSYLNLPGLCLYEKFGFVYDKTVASYFPSYNNIIPLLPMSLNINNHFLFRKKKKEEKQNLLLKIICNCANPPYIPKSKICTIDTKFQQLLGKLKILFLCMENQNVHVLLNKENKDCVTFVNLLNELFPTRVFTCLSKIVPISFQKRESEKIKNKITELESKQPLKKIKKNKTNKMKQKTKKTRKQTRKNKQEKTNKKKQTRKQNQFSFNNNLKFHL